MLAKIKFLIILVLVYTKESDRSHWRGGANVSWSLVDYSVVFPIVSTNVNIRKRYFDRLGYGVDDSCQ